MQLMAEKELELIKVCQLVAYLKATTQPVSDHKSILWQFPYPGNTNELRLTGYGFDPSSKTHNSCVEDICIRMFWGDDVALRT